MTAVDSVAAAPANEGALQKHSIWARVLAEFAGSLLICLAIYLMCTFGSAFYSVNMAYMALGTGVVYAAMTLIFGKISGAQFNPAITVAAMLTSKTKVLDGVLYIIAQLVGCIGAGALFALILPTSDSITASQWYNMAVNGFDEGSVLYSSMNSLGLTFNATVAIIVELAASIIVVAAAMRTMKQDGAPTREHTLGMGLAYAAAVALSFPVTGASVNPIRATGVAIFATKKGLAVEPVKQLWVFWVCAILAAAIVALVIIVAQLLSARSASDVLVETDPAAAAMEEQDEAAAVENGDQADVAGYVPVIEENAEVSEEISQADQPNGDEQDQ